MLKCILLLAVAVASLAILSARPVYAVPTLSAPLVTVGTGDTFAIPISIMGAVDLISWQFDLAFMPAIVKANSVTEGPFLSSSGTAQTLFIPGVIDNGGGHVLGTADFFTDISPPPSASGVLANIEFTALAPGVSPLRFSNVFLNLSDQGFETANGQITVRGTSRIPEPTTLMLLAGGLMLLAARLLTNRLRRD
jgi:hypothetical protein